MKISTQYTSWRRLLLKLANVEIGSKNILNIILFSLTLILFYTGNPQIAIAQDAHGSVYTDYFDHITLFSQGRITRFTQMPIQVYISPILKESPYLPEIRYAMQEWHTASEGDIRFEETETPQNADIRVSWGHSGLHTDFQDMRLGSAELTRLKDTKQMVVQDPADASPPFTVEVILMLEGDGTIGELSQKEMRTVCLHEFGHAIGLWGHSPHPGDISYPTATAQHPSTRDITTLRELYNTPLNTPQHDIAIQVLKSEIAAKPYAEKQKRLRHHYLLGTVHFDKGDTASAIRSFLTCRQLNAKFQPAIEKLIQVYHETGKTHDAIALLEKRITQKPSPADYNTLGILYYERKEAEKAIQAFEKALHIAPYHKAARRNLHQLLRAKGFRALAVKDFETAATTFERVLRMDPLDAPTYQLMGNGYAQVGQFETAINYYQKAIDINPVDTLTKHHLAECYNNYGVTLRNRGEWDAAIDAYRNALLLMPTFGIARTNLGDVFTRKANAHTEAGELDAAVNAYLELQKLHPNEMQVRNLLGELYLKKGDYAEALSAFQHVYNIAPNAEHALHNLIAAYHHYARSLSDTEEYTTAIQLLQTALQLAPTDLNLRLSLANVYQGAGNYERAAAEVSRVLAQEPENPQAKEEEINLRIRRGNSLMGQRQYAAAIAEFEGIPESKRNIEIYNTLGYLYLVEGEHQKALSGFETVLQKDPINMPAFRNLLSLESQLIRHRFEKMKIDILTKVRCTLALTLIRRKQTHAAIEKYQLALKSKSEEMDALLIETGKHLANWFQQYGDTENREIIIRWVEERSGR
ncbi:tetratricopeptide repeat protein [Candidatus Poribacteria bacterium]|nr:tetratricopeptide repeat protein [Candidatus Poribacteria bacterium]MYG07232.1 tetratricopeptide repeat protein [Candidatus Poribacteria bacterium]MYK22564.1 tetratricopeptide repeat protein [Candidatus Poribacteria bacterium]